MNLPSCSENEYLVAVDRLSAHVNNKDIFSTSKQNGGVGLTISKDLSKKMYRQSYYKHCIFSEANLTNIGFAGSKFIDTNFEGCDFSNGNLHSCSFKDVIFRSSSKYAKLENAGFHKSTFTNCKFENLVIYSCGFTEAVFYNVKFENCTIRLCSLENVQFVDCTFINVNMSTLNLEYAEFENIKAEKCVLPFHTICSTYGLLSQLSNLSHNHVFSADTKVISIQEYLTLLPEFEKYYNKNEKYFPLANIYIASSESNLAYEAIMIGIVRTIQVRDFRSLKYFCKLVYLNNIFPVKQRRLLFENINKWVSTENFSLAEYHDYQLSAGMIRDLLLNEDSKKPTLNFYLETNIEPYEMSKQVQFLTVIDQILEECQISSSSIEMRHNSAFIDFVTVVCDNIEQVSKVLLMVYGSLTGITVFATGIKKIIESSQTILLNNDQHQKNKLETRKLHLEIEMMEKEQHLTYAKSSLEYEKAKLEYEEALKNSGKYKEILLDENVKVIASHSSKNLRDVPFPEIMQYRS